MVQAGDIIVDRYVIQQLIREGVLHTYWLAFDQTLERPVTVKMIRSNVQFDAMGIDRLQAFRYDAATLAKLEHPHVLPVYDLGDTDDYLYVITRYIEDSQSFTQSLQEQDWSNYEILQFVSRLASAVDFIHEKNIVHADLNPNNIVIGTQKHPYIGNFTVMSIMNVMREQNIPTYAGTPGFTAPEILTSMEVTPSADLYSFGKLIFYAFTKSWPPKIPLITGESLPSVRKDQAQLPIGLDVVVDRLTRTSPEERYPTAMEAVDELTKVFYSGQSDIEGRVFISYARKDKDYVYTLAKELRRVGVNIWIDQDIEPGSNWDDSIENALNDCDMMLLIATPDSMASEYVTHEWSYVMGSGKPVYPFIPPFAVPDNIHPRLQRVQHIVGADDMLANISQIVDVLAGGTPTKLIDEDL